LPRLTETHQKLHAPIVAKKHNITFFTTKLYVDDFAVSFADSSDSISGK
jgi:hypothetical protein